MFMVIIQTGTIIKQSGTSLWYSARRRTSTLVHVAVGVVVLLHAWVHVRVHAGIDARVNRRVQQRIVAGSSFHRGNNRHVLHRRVGVLMVVVRHVVVLLVLELLMVELLLVLRLEVLVLLCLEVVVVKKLWLVSHSSCGCGCGRCTAVAVQWLFHQRSGVLGSLLLTTHGGEVGLRRVVVGWVDHTQDPHLRVLLVVVVVATVELIGLLLHLLGLVLLRWVQVSHQSVATLASLGVRHSLSLGGVLDGGSERAGSLALEVHRLGLGRVDDNLALLLLVEHGLDVLHQVLFTGERLDDVALAVSGHKETAVFVVNARGRERHPVLVLGQLLTVQLLLVQLLLQMVLLLQVVLLLQWVLLQVLVLQVLLLQVLLLHLLLLQLRRRGGTHVHTAVVRVVVLVVAHDRRGVGEIMTIGQRNRSSGGVVQLLLVMEVLLLQVLVLGRKSLTGRSFIRGGRSGHGGVVVLFLFFFGGGFFGACFCFAWQACFFFFFGAFLTSACVYQGRRGGFRRRVMVDWVGSGGEQTLTLVAWDVLLLCTGSCCGARRVSGRPKNEFGSVRSLKLSGRFFGKQPNKGQTAAKSGSREFRCC